MRSIRYLAIETSCDETAVSIVQGHLGSDGPASASVRRTSSPFVVEELPRHVTVSAHVVVSQTESHQPFGGVVPEVAARDHNARITGLVREALRQSNLRVSDLDGIAVTLGPGLIGALMVGVLFARGLSLATGLPLIAVNHVDAHLAPALLLSSFHPATQLGLPLEVHPVTYPALALTVSGGHCHLSRLQGPVDRTILGRTSDDACGEAFDKVAKLLGLPYPGGPEIERLATRVTSSRFTYPWLLADRSNRWGFSFSGLKTAVLETVRKLTFHNTGKVSGASLPEDVKAEIAWAFQEAALGQLVDRIRNALSDGNDSYRSVVVAGGVAANTRFRTLLEGLGLPIRVAPTSLCSDNATMIGLQAFLERHDGLPVHPFARYADTPWKV